MSRWLVLLFIVLIVVNVIFVGYFFIINKRGIFGPGNAKINQVTGDPDPLPRSVKLISEIPNLKVTLSDQKFIQQYLDSIGFWNFRAIHTRGIIRTPVTAELLEIHIVSIPLYTILPINRENGKQTQSIGVMYEQDQLKTVQLYVYLSPAIIKSTDVEELEETISWQTLFGLKYLTDANVTNNANAPEIQQLAGKVFINIKR